MDLQRKNKKKVGQSIMEYTVIIAIVITALTIMQVYLKRGIQAATKVAADQLSVQNYQEINLQKGGYLYGANVSSATTSTRNAETGALISGGMDMQKRNDETTTTTSSSVYNLGNIGTQN